MPVVAENFDREVDPQQQIRHFVKSVRRSWLTILTCVGVGLLAGISAFLYVPKSWTSTAKVQLKSGWMFEEGELKSKEELSYSARRAQLEEQLRSTTWVTEALDKLEWPEWSRANATVEGRQKFVERVKLHVKPSVDLGELGERNVYVSFSWSDRHQAADFCNALLGIWIDNAVASYLEELNRRVSDGQRLLAQKSDELRRVNENLELFEMRNGVSALNQHQNTQERADQLSLDLDALGGSIASLQAQIDELDRQLAATGPDGRLLIPPTLEGSPLLSEEKTAQLARMQQEYQELQTLVLEHYTEKWPRVKVLHEDLAQLLVQLSAASDAGDASAAAEPNPKYEEIKAQRDELDLQLQGQLASKAYVEDKLKDAGDVLKTMPQVLRQYDDLRLGKAAAQQAVLDQKQALQPVLDRKTVADAKGPKGLLPYSKLEPPWPAPTPTASLGWLVLAVCTMLGIGIAVATVIGRELLRTSFAHAEQTRAALKLVVLGEVAPIQTAHEARRSHFQRTLQVAASVAVLFGLAAMIVVCVVYPDHLPAGLVRWAQDLRDALV